ncbi:MAG TPA: hypothetical protein VHC90_24510 [Bryobacteraceae bacterium]|nr:hypothetical protein [Bryobacteraceae bacterium]
MRARRCTIDTSCLIALDTLRLIPWLSLLFGVVLVPRAVRREFFKRRNAKDRLRILFRDFAFLRRCNDYDAAAVEIHLIERARTDTRDRGEAEAVVQAAQIGAMVIVDDPWGRWLAARNSLESHGTLWLLQQFHSLGLLTSSAAREAFLQLRRTGIRLPWREVDAFLNNIGTRGLAAEE